MGIPSSLDFSSLHFLVSEGEYGRGVSRSYLAYPYGHKLLKLGHSFSLGFIPPFFVDVAVQHLRSLV